MALRAFKGRPGAGFERRTLPALAMGNLTGHSVRAAPVGACRRQSGQGQAMNRSSGFLAFSIGGS